MLVKNCKKEMYSVSGNRSVTVDIPSLTICVVEQTLNTRTLTPVSSDITDSEAFAPNFFLLGNANVSFLYLTCAKEFLDNSKIFRQTQAYANLNCDRFCKEFLLKLNNRQKWRSTAMETPKEGDLDCLIEDGNKRGY